MKKNFITVASALILAGAIAMPVNLESKPSPKPLAAAAGAQAGKRERHPEIQRALRALQNARAALAAGAHHFHGHRVKALKLVDEAISECQAALASD